MLAIVIRLVCFAKAKLVFEFSDRHIAGRPGIVSGTPNHSREPRMHPVLNRNLYLVKEHVGFFKAANNFDIYDPQTNEQIMQCRENRLGFFTKLLRFTDIKRYTPFHIEVSTPSGEPIVHVRRGFSILLSKVDVLDGDEEGTRIGGFKQQLLSFSGAFHVLDANDHPICH
jgi:hypothetical protein